MNKAIDHSATRGAGRAVIYARYSSEHQREASARRLGTCKNRKGIRHAVLEGLCSFLEWPR